MSALNLSNFFNHIFSISCICSTLGQNMSNVFFRVQVTKCTLNVFLIWEEMSFIKWTSGSVSLCSNPKDIANFRFPLPVISEVIWFTHRFVNKSVLDIECPRGMSLNSLYCFLFKKFSRSYFNEFLSLFLIHELRIA